MTFFSSLVGDRNGGAHLVGIDSLFGRFTHAGHRDHSTPKLTRGMTTPLVRKGVPNTCYRKSNHSTPKIARGMTAPLVGKGCHSTPTMARDMTAPLVG